MPLRRRQFFGAAGSLAVASRAVREVTAQQPADEERPRPEPVPLPPRPEQGLLFSCKYGMTEGRSLEERLAAAREAGMDGVDFDAAASVAPEALREAAGRTGVFIHNAINHGHW